MNKRTKIVTLNFLKVKSKLKKEKVISKIPTAK